MLITVGEKMSTNSYIAYQKENGKYRLVYCHFDGYPDGVGASLLGYYNSLEDVIKLVEAGNMSTVGEPYTDRGETYEMNAPQDYDSFDSKPNIEYLYVFQEGKWIVSDYGTEFQDLEVLLSMKSV